MRYTAPAQIPSLETQTNKIRKQETKKKRQNASLSIFPDSEVRPPELRDTTFRSRHEKPQTIKKSDDFLSPRPPHSHIVPISACRTSTKTGDAVRANINIGGLRFPKLPIFRHVGKEYAVRHHIPHCQHLEKITVIAFGGAEHLLGSIYRRSCASPPRQYLRNITTNYTGACMGVGTPHRKRTSLGSYGADNTKLGAATLLSKCILGVKCN